MIRYHVFIFPATYEIKGSKHLLVNLFKEQKTKTFPEFRDFTEYIGERVGIKRFFFKNSRSEKKNKKKIFKFIKKNQKKDLFDTKEFWHQKKPKKLKNHWISKPEIQEFVCLTWKKFPYEVNFQIDDIEMETDVFISNTLTLPHLYGLKRFSRNKKGFRCQTSVINYEKESDTLVETVYRNSDSIPDDCHNEKKVIIIAVESIVKKDFIFNFLSDMKEFYVVELYLKALKHYFFRLKSHSPFFTDNQLWAIKVLFVIYGQAILSSVCFLYADKISPYLSFILLPIQLLFLAYGNAKNTIKGFIRVFLILFGYRIIYRIYSSLIYSAIYLVRPFVIFKVGFSGVKLIKNTILKAIKSIFRIPNTIFQITLFLRANLPSKEDMVVFFTKAFIHTILSPVYLFELFLDYLIRL